MALAAGLALTLSPAAAVVERGGPASGVIVAANGDEEMRFVAEQDWRIALIRQALLAGDALRTGPAGALALRFADETLIRMHHNAALIVKKVLGGAELRLDAGRIWARAAREGQGLEVETPSATVAIRGTNWSLSVEGPRTTLVVIEGVVVMSNPQGSVTVTAGEAAVAEIGRAPTKIILTNPPGREQLLYYLTLRDAFAWLPLAPGSLRDGRLRHAEIKATPAERRGAEGWLAMAELGLKIEGRAAMARALAEARALGLSPAQAARADLAEGILKAAARDWNGAAAAFAAAEPRLQGERRLAARFGRYLALALAGRRREALALQPSLEPFRDSRRFLVVQAWLRGNIGELEAALADLRKAMERHPGDPDLAVLASEFAIALGRDREARALVDQALALDPDHHEGLNAKAMLLLDYDRRPERAIALLERALAGAPGNPDLWNTLGLARKEQGDESGAAAAFERAIALDPDSPLAHANYAILLLDEDLPDPAKAQIERAKALDPAFYVGRIAEGRWLIQEGRVDEARDAFLEAVAVNPALSNSYLALAIAQYQDGELARAEQALGNANRLDPHDPIVPLVDTVIALDHAEADRAITSAREAYRRYRRRGEGKLPLATTSEGGSYLNAAFAQLSLDDWGRFYGDLTFNPFDPASQFFQAVAPRVPLAETGSTSEAAGFDLGPLLQGLLLDPLAVSSRNRYTDLLRRPFMDASLGAGVAFDEHGEIGWSADAEIQGYADLARPVAFNLTLGRAESDAARRDETNDDLNANLFLGGDLSLSDRILLIGGAASLEDEIPRESAFLGGRDRLDLQAQTLGLGYSHDFGPRNVLFASAIAARTVSEASLRADLAGVPLALDSREEEEGVFFGLGHAIERGALTARAGLEGQTIARQASSLSTLGGLPIDAVEAEGDGLQGRAYGDLAWRLGERVLAQGGLYLSHYDDGIETDRLALEPRIGLAWRAAEGQWLRAAYREEMRLATVSSLAPVATVGLTAGLAPVDAGGEIRSALGRWDAEWSRHLFTAVEVEHQEIGDFAAGIRDTLDPLGQLVAEEGRIDRLSLFANAWLGHGIGLFGEFTWSDSENESGDANDGEPLPLVPEWRGRAGLTWVHPSQLRVTLAENLIGERAGDASGTLLGEAATTDVELSWQPFDKHLEIAAAILNLLDEDYELASGIEAPGTTFLLRGEVRF